MTYMLIYTNPTNKKENKDRFFTVCKKPLLVSPALPDAKMLNFVFLTLICLVNLQPSSCQEDRRNAIISSMEKAVMFLAEKHDKINVDAVLGFSVLEAYSKMVMETWQPQLGLTIERQRILVMREKLLTFMEKAAQDIEKQDPVSHKEFAPALKPGFWKVPQEWKKINDSIPYSPTSGNCLDLKTSDFCISAVLGTQDSADKCWIPDNCTSLMINTHCNGYSLSHQLFYFLFAKMQACPNSLFQNAGYYENVFCDLMMQTNRNIEKNNLFDTFGDLFTENKFLARPHSQLAGPEQRMFLDVQNSLNDDLLLPYLPPQHGPQHHHRYIRDCQALLRGNATHETWPSDNSSASPLALTHTFVSDFPLHHPNGRLVYGHLTIVRDPLRTFSVLEPGGPGGCHLHRRATVEETVSRSQCLVAQNGGFFNTKTGACLGNIVSDGQLVQSGGVQNAQFGIRKDGTLVFGYLSEEEVLATENPFVQLVSGVGWILRDGEVYLNQSQVAECDKTQESGTRLKAQPSPPTPPLEVSGEWV
ncbi:PREDICTED: uncharacterized protein LOC106549565 [Thamnophis sirtalis]|uniref:Uncharacterized protein LOC106549565 n=1 Tax=Thamnophis sirtalis TaxID=35019 RepID=A0A6I9YEX2_9SAUR|nr:PREDICTED: uncharacterized protein LOC106549565 [Thamnophis sirtalis]